jgi:integrase
MMPKFNDNISEEGILNEDEVRRMFNKCGNDYERALIAFAWATGARPSELLEIKKEDVIVEEDKIVVFLNTKKLKKGTTFQMKKRQLEFDRPQGMEMNPFIEFIAEYMRCFKYDDLPIFPYTTTRWMNKVMHRAGEAALGRQISVYHLRHSAITREAQKNASIAGLMHFKGAKSLRSVLPYVHATPYKIMMERKKDIEFQQYLEKRKQKLNPQPTPKPP